MSRPGDRRQFLSLSSRAFFAGLLAPGVTLAATKNGSADAAVAKTAAPTGNGLYDNAFVLDGNSTPGIGRLCCNEDTAEALKTIRESGLSAMKTTMGGFEGSFEETVGEIAAVQKLVEHFPERFLKVARHDDLERAKREQKLALILSFEAASMLGDKPDRIETFRNLDVLVMQLSYNRKSPFGCGCLDGDSDGVTPLGRDAIAQMNKLGVALDLSHANVATTADGIAASTKPVVITHAGCRAVFDHPRNKNDREMKAMADKGGVMGIYMLPFLTEDTRQPMLADFMRHMTHALDVCGEDHVGIGTDLWLGALTDEDIAYLMKYLEERRKKGIAAPGENRPLYIPDLNTPRRLERVADAMQKQGIGSRTVEKVLGLNFSRVYRDIWAA